MQNNFTLKHNPLYVSFEKFYEPFPGPYLEKLLKYLLR